MLSNLNCSLWDPTWYVPSPHSLAFRLSPSCLPHSHCFSWLYLNKCPGISYLGGLPGAFFTRLPAWLTTSPLTSFCSAVPFSMGQLSQPLCWDLQPGHALPGPSGSPTYLTLLCGFPQHCPSSNIPHNVYIHVKFVGLVLLDWNVSWIWGSLSLFRKRDDKQQPPLLCSQNISQEGRKVQ